MERTALNEMDGTRSSSEIRGKGGIREARPVVPAAFLEERRMRNSSSWNDLHVSLTDGRQLSEE